MVPQKVLDTELKKSFAHFNEGRIPVSILGFSTGLWVFALIARVQRSALTVPPPRVSLQSLCVVLQRWCWRHPWGSDLLRMASFQNNIYHEKDDIRCVCVCVNCEFKSCSESAHRIILNTAMFLLCRNLEMILFGCQSSLCVVVELGDELPSPTDIQLAHSRLRALCLGGGTESVHAIPPSTSSEQTLPTEGVN